MPTIDHVIVVDLGMPLKPAKELLTVVDVMNQSINLMIKDSIIKTGILF